MESLFDHAGGEAALHRLEEIFYGLALQDPVLREIFPRREPTHVEQLTAFTAESFGGPATFTRDIGFDHLIAVHRGLKITEEQRARFVDVYLTALDRAGMPTDHPFRAAVREHVEFGSRVAVQNSWAEDDSELHPIREVPHWTWRPTG